VLVNFLLGAEQTFEGHSVADAAKVGSRSDAGQIKLHIRARPGTRIETTKILFSQVEDQIRKTIPPDETELIMDSIGLTP